MSEVIGSWRLVGMKQEIQRCLSDAQRYVEWCNRTLEHCKRYPKGAHFDGNLYKDPEGNVWKHSYFRLPNGQAKGQWVKLHREGFTQWQETQETIPELTVKVEGGSVTLVNETLHLSRLREDDDEAWEPARDNMSTEAYTQRGLTTHIAEVSFYNHLKDIPEQDILDWCKSEGQLAYRESDYDWDRFIDRFAPDFVGHKREILHDALLCLIHTEIDKAAGIQRTWMF